MTAKGKLTVSNFLMELAKGTPGSKESRKDALRTELSNGIVIDTCFTADTGYWETGIIRNGHCIVPEDYEDREEAYEGHEKWIDIMTSHPDFELKDVHNTEDGTLSW